MKPTTHTCKGCGKVVDRLVPVTVRGRTTGVVSVRFPCVRCYSKSVIVMLRNRGEL